jgi:hypothetical protein
VLHNDNDGDDEDAWIWKFMLLEEFHEDWCFLNLGSILGWWLQEKFLMRSSENVIYKLHKDSNDLHVTSSYNWDLTNNKINLLSWFESIIPLIDVGLKFITPDLFENILDSIVEDEVREVHCSLELGVAVQIFYRSRLKLMNWVCVLHEFVGLLSFLCHAFVTQ